MSKLTFYKVYLIIENAYKEYSSMNSWQSKLYLVQSISLILASYKSKEILIALIR